jgi:hypothetical protein
MKNRLEYNKLLEKQAKLQEQIKEIDSVIETVNYFADQLIYTIPDTSSWHIIRNKLNGELNKDKQWRRQLSPEQYEEAEAAGIEYIRKSLEVNDIQYDF